MAREGISFEIVAEVCDKLQAEGRKISVRSIHAETGGSMSTVLEHFRRWQEQQTAMRGEERHISDQFKDALIVEISKHVRATRSVMEEQLNQAEGRARESEELLKEAEVRAEELRAALKEGERVRGELEKQLAASEEKAATHEKRINEAAKTTEELRKVVLEAEKRIAVAEAVAKEREKQIALLRLEKTSKEKVAAEQRAAVAEAKLSNLKEKR